MQANRGVFKRHTFEQFDGSIWRQYETAEYLYILTGAGRRLFARQHLFGMLSAYIADYADGRDGPGDTRSFLAEGSNSRVFSLSQDIAIKESRPRSDPLIAALHRMDRLKDAIEKHCPRWIDVPTQYGVMMSKSHTNQQFLMMQKIDHGVTIGDVIDTRSKDSRMAHGILSASSFEKFGPITPGLEGEVNTGWDTLKRLVRQALMAEYLSPDLYLPDLDNNPYNIVLDRADPPIAGSHLTYWIIDQ